MRGLRKWPGVNPSLLSGRDKRLDEPFFLWYNSTNACLLCSAFQQECALGSGLCHYPHCNEGRNWDTERGSNLPSMKEQSRSRARKSANSLTLNPVLLTRACRNLSEKSCDGICQFLESAISQAHSEMCNWLLFVVSAIYWKTDRECCGKVPQDSFWQS